MSPGLLLAPNFTRETIFPQAVKNIFIQDISINDLAFLLARHLECSKTVPILVSGMQYRISRPCFIALIWRNGRQSFRFGKLSEKTFDNSKAAPKVAQQYVNLPYLRIAIDGYERGHDIGALKISESPLRNSNRLFCQDCLTASYTGQNDCENSDRDGGYCSQIDRINDPFEKCAQLSHRTIPWFGRADRHRGRKPMRLVRLHPIVSNEVERERMAMIVDLFRESIGKPR
jgi:hypothetical protein